ncbi:MAG TPA: trypsin-like peptidase domain-containing protein [Candidatus Babeliales bacterium]|jgi:serine protease Do|nr:trypsin-like peptidase domain-containing protein [Candidatus Babeliales bacterium]
MSPLFGFKRGAIAVAVVFCSGAGWLFAQAQDQSASQQVREIFSRAAKAVVKIHGVDEHSEICGTGFFVDPTGTIYTAYTVGGEAGNFTVEYGDKRVPARQLVADIRSGTAILKVDETTPALPIGKSEELELASPVLSIGYPLDLQKTPNFGMIAGFDRKCLGRYFSTIHLRVNVPTQRGEAGAPLLNMKGEVVGIVVSGLGNNSACYAVPIEAAEKIRSDFVRFGEARHGWIGVNDVSPASQQVDGSRAMVTQVAEDAPASRAGLKAGDVLLEVGKKKITDPEDVFDASFYITAGDTVPITVMRGDKKITLQVQATMHPASKTGVLLASPGAIPGVVPMSLDEDASPSP